MKPTLNEQLARMQKLAGIIKENQVSEATGIDAVDYTVRILNKFKRSVPFDAPTILKKAESLKNYIESQYDTEEIGAEMAYTEIDDMIDAVNNGDDIMSVIDTAIANLNLSESKESQTNEGYDEFQRADKGSKGVTAKDKGEEEVYGAGVKKGEEIEKEKMTKSKLKSKIKEMILAELNEDDDVDINNPGDLNNMYDPLAESKDDPQTAEEYYELFKEEDLIDDRREYDIEDFTLGGMDYQTAFELERILQPLDINDVDLGSITVEGNIYDDGYISSAKFKDGVDLIADQRIDLEDLLGKDKIAKLTNLNEAKKDEEVEDVTVDDTEVVDAPASDMMAGESAEVSGIQANLQAAYAEAKALGDEKLITQIANTITYFTKAHILDTAPVNEAITNDNAIYDILSNMDNEDIINDMFTAIQQNPSMKLEDFLNQYDGGNDLGDDNDDNYDDSMDVYDDSYPDMAEAKEMEDKRKILDQVRNKLLGLFQPYGNFQISDMTMKGQNLGTEFRLYSKSKDADWKGLENFMKNNPDFSIKNISKQTFDNPKSIDFSYKTDQINENMFPMLKRILR